MAIRKASAQTTINRGTVAAAVATVNQITIAPATVASVAGGGSLGGGTISNVAIMSDATYTTVLSGDTAVSTAGGFIRITGTGFRSGANVYLGSTLLTNTFVSSTTINAVVPATSAGSYNLFVMNPDNNGVIGPPVATSGFPTFSQTSYTVASLTLNTQLLATGDAPLTYYIQPGSSNPQNLSVSTSGLLTGTLPSDATYTLTVIVDDVQGQSTQATITINASTAEPYFNLTTLSLPGDGTNNAQNNTFLDSSSNNFSITRNGNATQGTFTPFSQTGWSNFFNSTNTDHLALPFNSVDVAANNFALEAWVYVFDRAGIYTVFNSQTNASTASGSSYGLNIQATNGFLDSSWYVGGGTYNLQGTTAVPLNQWNHCALVRTGGTMSIYLNGVRQATRSDMSTNTINAGSASLQPYIGRNGTFYPFNGFISDFRIVIGSHPYDATSTSLTVPTSRLTAVTNTAVLACNSNRFADTNTQAAAKTITVAGGTPSVQAFSPFAPTAAYTAAAVGGSGYFDGTGDFLTLGTSTNLALGAGDFTIDVWLYLTAYNGSLGVIFDWRTAGSTPTNIPLFSISSSGVPAFWQSVSLGAAITGSSAVPRNTWTHLAVVRNGLGSNNLTMYLNGTSIGSATATNSLGIETLRLNDSQGSFGQAGYFSSARIVKGTAVYTANFTPPTAPLTAIANTQLLLNFTNGGITDATAKNVLETVGDAKISTAQSKFGGSSMLFDGTDDRLKIPYNPNLLLGSSNFTVEMWLYKLANTAYMVAAGNLSAPSSAAWTLISDVNGNLISWYTNGNFQMTSTTSLATSTWYHLAITRSGTTGRLFINGVQESTWTDSVNYNVTNDLFIGNDAQLISGRHWNGYIEDFRITRGFARYTANFTPPTAAFSLR